MKKIIYFDCWTQGVSNYEYIDIHLREKYRTFLLHVESLIVPYFAPHIDTSWYRKDCEQTIGGIRCRDVSAYGGLKIAEILKQESPDLVIMLSLSHLHNRIMTAACKRLGIKVVYMMHGWVFSQEDNQLLVDDLKKSNKFSFLLKCKKVLKFLHLLVEYRVASRNMYDTLNIALQLFSAPFSFVWNPKRHHSLDVDRCFAYTDLDIVSISETHKISAEKIVVIGNPKIDWALAVDKQNKAKHRILYIEQSLTEQGWISDKEQAALLFFLKETAIRNNLEFVIRLHPGTNRKLFIQKFGEGYTLTPDREKIEDSFREASIVAGHASTALSESIACRIPTISILWLSNIASKSIIGDSDVGIVRKKKLFEKKLVEFQTQGWMQEDTRELFFPRGESLASENAVFEIEQILRDS